MQGYPTISAEAPDHEQRHFQGVVGYTGTALYPVETSTPVAGITVPTSATFMNGSGNITNVGGGVSGTYEVGNVGLGWNADKGTFSGSMNHHPDFKENA